MTYSEIMLFQDEKSTYPKSDCPIPLGSIDVHKQTKTSLDEYNRKASMITGTLMEKRSLSDLWIGVTRFTHL